MPEKSGLFAEKLRGLRREAGLSQTELAERAGIPVSTIRGFEIGRREPTFATLLKLARGLGVSLAAFEVETPGAEAESPPRPRGKGAGSSAALPDSQRKPRGQKARKPRGG